MVMVMVMIDDTCERQDETNDCGDSKTYCNMNKCKKKMMLLKMRVNIVFTMVVQSAKKLIVAIFVVVNFIEVYQVVKVIMVFPDTSNYLQFQM